jgi:hypothetical protein
MLTQQPKVGANKKTKEHIYTNKDIKPKLRELVPLRH